MATLPATVLTFALPPGTTLDQATLETVVTDFFQDQLLGTTTNNNNNNEDALVLGVATVYSSETGVGTVTVDGTWKGSSQNVPPTESMLTTQVFDASGRTRLEQAWTEAGMTDISLVEVEIVSVASKAGGPSSLTEQDEDGETESVELWMILVLVAVLVVLIPAVALAAVAARRRLAAAAVHKPMHDDDEQEHAAVQPPTSGRRTKKYSGYGELVEESNTNVIALAHCKAPSSIRGDEESSMLPLASDTLASSQAAVATDSEVSTSPTIRQSATTTAMTTTTTALEPLEEGDHEIPTLPHTPQTSNTTTAHITQTQDAIPIPLDEESTLSEAAAPSYPMGYHMGPAAAARGGGLGGDGGRPPLTSNHSFSSLSSGASGLLDVLDTGDTDDTKRQSCMKPFSRMLYNPKRLIRVIKSAETKAQLIDDHASLEDDDDF